MLCWYAEGKYLLEREKLVKENVWGLDDAGSRLEL